MATLWRQYAFETVRLLIHLQTHKPAQASRNQVYFLN